MKLFLFFKTKSKLNFFSNLIIYNQNFNKYYLTIKINLLMIHNIFQINYKLFKRKKYIKLKKIDYFFNF